MVGVSAPNSTMSFWCTILATSPWPGRGTRQRPPLPEKRGRSRAQLVITGMSSKLTNCPHWLGMIHGAGAGRADDGLFWMFRARNLRRAQLKQRCPAPRRQAALRWFGQDRLRRPRSLRPARESLVIEARPPPVGLGETVKLAAFEHMEENQSSAASCLACRCQRSPSSSDEPYHSPSFTLFLSVSFPCILSYAFRLGHLL